MRILSSPLFVALVPIRSLTPKAPGVSSFCHKSQEKPPKPTQILPTAARLQRFNQTGCRSGVACASSIAQGGADQPALPNRRLVRDAMSRAWAPITSRLILDTCSKHVPGNSFRRTRLIARGISKPGNCPTAQLTRVSYILRAPAKPADGTLWAFAVRPLLIALALFAVGARPRMVRP